MVGQVKWCRSAIYLSLVAAISSIPSLSVSQTVQAKTKPFDLQISNTGCFRGKGIAPYVEQAIAQRRHAARRGNAGELASFYVRVPSRAWRGLTVTAIGLHYETTSVYFREPVATVRRVLQANGLTIEANDRIPITNEEAVEVQNLRATPPESRMYGTTEVNCGV